MGKKDLLNEMTSEGIRIKKYIAEILDFPEEGISFKDITPILQSPALFKDVSNIMEKLAKSGIREFKNSNDFNNAQRYFRII